MKASLRRLLPVVLLVVACGDSREEERQDKIEDFCNTLVGKTLRDGEVELSAGAYERGLVQPFESCSTEWQPLSDNDVCAYGDATPVCLLGWNFYPNDPNACTAQGCWYACMVHVSQADLEASTSTAEIPICASRFVKGQPIRVLR